MKIKNFSEIFYNLQSFFLFNQGSIFKNQKDFFKSIIFLNDSDYIHFDSEKDFEKYEFYKQIIKLFKNFNDDIKKIAVDGSVKNLIKAGISFDFLAGDLDSSKDSLDKLNEDSKIIHLPDQDYCDFEKSIEFCESKNLLPSIILGINGGSFGKIIQNLHLLLKFSQYLNIGISDDQIFFVLESNDIEDLVKVSVKNHSKISIFGFQSFCNSSSDYKKTLFETRGLKWDISKENHSINFGCRDSIQSISNKVEDNAKGNDEFIDFEIKVFEGKILIIISLI